MRQLSRMFFIAAAAMLLPYGGQAEPQVSPDGLRITVRDMSGLQLVRPVTGGVPVGPSLCSN